MAKFISAHVITCMTRQELERLIRRLSKDATNGILLREASCDTLSGRMVCTWDAPGEEALVTWLEERNVRFRGSEEWCMRVQMESRDGRLAPAGAPAPTVPEKTAE